MSEFGVEELFNSMEIGTSDDSGRLVESYRAEEGKAMHSGNSERESRTKSQLEQMESSQAERAMMEKIDRKVRQYRAQIERANNEGNVERRKYYEAKLSRSGHEPSFLGETLYEKDKRRQAEEKYDQKKKMSDIEKLVYKKDHSHLTSHQLKQLDELNRKKK